MNKVHRSNNLAIRIPLTRERILLAASELADKNGLASVSMRQVAQSLGVEAMSLYKYVSSKDDLLDGLVEIVAFQMDVPALDSGWKEAMLLRSHSERRILNLHPWATSLFESRSGTGPTRLSHQERLIGIIRRAGFSIELGYNLIVAVNSFVYGFVIQEQTWYASPEDRPRAVSQSRPTITNDEYPYVYEMMTFIMAKIGENAEFGSRTEAGYVANFEFGLKLILDGFERTMQKK
ncbi:MAG: TetR/AcrR family transcriptional regulator [Bacteriovorax sp.]|nr:TetR/AcrR family transcriptional regulator [Bacteriovorax sp.]